MKLLICTCGDGVFLTMRERACECGASRGKYLDASHAEYQGPGFIAALSNDSLSHAVRSSGTRVISLWRQRDGRRIRKIDSRGKIIVPFTCHKGDDRLACGGRYSAEEFVLYNAIDGVISALNDQIKETTQIKEIT